MTKDTFFPARDGWIVSGGSAKGNVTWMEGEVWSAYSTSASASAVRQVRHQYTGFVPLYTAPVSTNRPNSRRIPAS